MLVQRHRATQNASGRWVNIDTKIGSQGNLGTAWVRKEKLFRLSVLEQES